MGSRGKEYNKPQRSTKKDVALTLLARSHSMATPSIERGTEDRIGPAQARTSMVDGFPYKEEVGGSSPSVPTKRQLILAES